MGVPEPDGVNERYADGLAVREWGDPADPAILLWPGLGSTGAYFAGIAAALPGRALAVDPPGSGRSAPLDRYTSDALIELAAGVAEAYGCQAIVGHSLGAYVAVGLAADPPAGLRAAVLLDGGFMDAAAMTELGMPVTSGREQLIAWMRANQLRFPDWESATRELAGIIGGEPTDMVEAYVRDVFAEVDGEIRERISPEAAADQVLAVVEHDVLSRARRVQVPTLLIASGQPAELRVIKGRSWRQFTEASRLIELNVEDAWGHNAIVQHPEASTRLIVDWLEKHL
jgi:pimeloyl-ACP methyl ester carboxylesterase